MTTFVRFGSVFKLPFRPTNKYVNNWGSGPVTSPASFRRYGMISSMIDKRVELLAEVIGAVLNCAKHWFNFSVKIVVLTNKPSETVELMKQQKMVTLI